MEQQLAILETIQPTSRQIVERIYCDNTEYQLIKVTIQKPNQLTETWQYQYDVLGRRIGKRLKSGENLQEPRFVWDGSHLIREENKSNAYSYTHPSSYEPLAQLVFAKNS